MRPAITQISMGIRTVWSESSLSAWQRMPRLIWVFAGRTLTLLVLTLQVVINAALRSFYKRCLIYYIINFWNKTTLSSLYSFNAFLWWITRTIEEPKVKTYRQSKLWFNSDFYLYINSPFICYSKFVSKLLQVFHLSRDMTKPTKWLRAQRRARSAWASAQSDESSLCA